MKQRAKQNWYRNGDRYTPFFHAWASHRRKINHIQKIQDDAGREWTKPEDISKFFIDFYQTLFTAGGIHGVEECLMGLEVQVSGEMNCQLLMAEVDMALKQMHLLKSHRPDGMSTCFYQHSWATMRNEVCMVVLDFLNNGIFDTSINDMYITLISKVKSQPELLSIGPSAFAM